MRRGSGPICDRRPEQALEEQLAGRQNGYVLIALIGSYFENRVPANIPSLTDIKPPPPSVKQEIPLIKSEVKQDPETAAASTAATAAAGGVPRPPGKEEDYDSSATV